MSARAVSSATIAFGLVSILIKLYAATRSKAVRFHLLHAADRCRLQQHYGCRACWERVERDQTVKGYEVGRGRHVVLTEEELEALCSGGASPRSSSRSSCRWIRWTRSPSTTRACSARTGDS